MLSWLSFYEVSLCQVVQLKCGPKQSLVKSVGLEGCNGVVGCNLVVSLQVTDKGGMMF